MNILEMSAGKELDALVAEKVMGWKRMFHPTTDKFLWAKKLSDEGMILEYIYEDEWNPSTDISAAYEMEGRISALGLQDDYAFELYRISGADETHAGIHKTNFFKVAHATPEQRCKAALLAMEGITE